MIENGGYLAIHLGADLEAPFERISREDMSVQIRRYDLGRQEKTHATCIQALSGDRFPPLRCHKSALKSGVGDEMNYRFVVTGGPGGGKTTVLNALRDRGYQTVPEAARRIIKDRVAAGLSPRPDPVSFGQEILSSDIEKYQNATACDHAVFFDRGVLDALYMLNSAGALTGKDVERYIQRFPYNEVVFLLPPWREIYVSDSERDQSFEESVEVYEGMKAWYAKWGYETVEVPRDNVNKRVSFILSHINNA